MNPEQLALVKQTFERVEPIAQEVGELFYNRLFEVDPALRQLFRGDMRRQGLMLITVIGMAIRSLDRPEVVAESVRALGQRHALYGVRSADYNTFGAALIWALEQVLGSDFTPEVKSAWIAAYTFLADAMRRAAPAEPESAAAELHPQAGHG
ncbi:MAG: globin family protein [Anaerolineae bacterium]|nr:globin domain-containing protein [Thermoflexales bacterium]MDW8395508.1 globin family protein [Anaerolineae bacterium]